jgi:holliday junction DNA helicase RuvA
MIAYIRGEVIEKDKDNLVILVGGLGMRVFVPVTICDTASIGETIQLNTYLAVKEDSLTLYGFDLAETRELFLLLLSVNGVGPRIALSILSTLSPDALRRAITAEQADVFARVPGVGKKTAQKILITLQDKIHIGSGLEHVAALSDVDTDLMSALTSLGYSGVESQAAIQSIPRSTPADLDTRLRIALQYFSR